MDTAINTFTPDEVAAGPRQMATNGASMTISPRDWAKSDISSRTLPLDKAQKIIKAYMDNPSWLADPRTAHAAAAVFGAATKVVGMNLQIERANAESESKRLKLSTDLRLTNHLNDGLAKLSDMTAVAEIRDELNASGPSPRAISLLNTALEKQSAAIEPQPMSMTLDDGTEVQGWMDPKTKRFTQYRPPSERSSAAPTAYPEPTIKDIGGKPFMFYRNFSPKPLDRLTPQQQQMVNVNAAALKQARKELVEAKGDSSRARAQKTYDRELQTFNELFDIISPRTPEPAATNAPAADATGKSLDADTARKILDEVGGDKDKARDLARQRGYKF